MSDFNIVTMLHEADNYANEKNFIEAGKIYTKITQLDNNCISAWYGLGICKAKLGEIGESISSLETMLQTWNFGISLVEGWNMFGYGCPQSIELTEVLSVYDDHVVIVKETI